MTADETVVETTQRETIQNSDFQKMANVMRPILLLVGAGMVIGMLGGLLFLKTASKEWEAHAMLRIGLTIHDQKKAESIESQANVVERIRADSFKQDLSRSLGTNSAWGPQDGLLLEHSLKATVIPGTDFIRVSARGYSREAAKIAVDAVTTKLRSMHDQMVKPSMEDVEQKLAYIESQIAAESKDVIRIESETYALFRRKEVGTAQVMLLSSMMDNASNQLSAFQRERLELLRIIKLVQASPTMPTAPTFVSSTPVFPNRLKVLVLAVVLGGILGSVFAWCQMKCKGTGRLPG